jgi:hypothetical protein
VFEHRRSADRMAAVMLVASVLGMVTAVVAFLSYGWMPGFGFFLLSLIAYALSRVFDLLGELLAAAGQGGQQEPGKPVKDDKDAGK